MKEMMLVRLLALSMALVDPIESQTAIEVDAVVVQLIDEVNVPAQEAGPVSEVVAREGARVKSGDVLLRIDDQDALLDVERAEIALEHAIEQAENDVKIRMAHQRRKVAELELKNAEAANLELEKVVSDSQMEKLRIELENSGLEIEQATKELAVARRGVAAARNALRVSERSLARRRMLAPSDGMIVRVRRNVGEWVQPGESVIRIVRDDRLRAEGFLSARQASSVSIGMPVEIWIDTEEIESNRLQGHVTFVSPEANPVNEQVRLSAEFENRDGQLRAGLSVRMTVKLPAPAKRP